MSPHIVHRVDEDRWFQQNQKLLLAIANTTFGRSLLYIPQDFPPIVHIRKNCVIAQVGPNTFKADFRIGAKYARIIRERWQEFNSYARYFQTETVNASPLTRYALSVSALTLTAYPDPNVETTTVDGYIEDYENIGFSNQVAAATGTSANDSGANMFAQSTPDGGPFNIQRIVTLFDTSALTSGATVSAAVVSILGGGKSSTDSYSVRLVATTPASNTALSTADWDQFGSTSLANEITLASYSTSAYNDFTMTDLTAVSKTSITKLGFRLTGEIAVSTPTGTNFIQAASADTALTTSDPKIVVTYTVASAARYLTLLGVGT